MAIQDASNGIRDRFVRVISFHQNGVETGDTAGICPSGSLKQLREQRENTWRITPRCWRLACGKADFSLGQCESSDAVHDQKDIATCLAKVFGDRRSEIGGAQTTTLRANPSGPRSRSMNSRTSRPRSPIRTTTLMSASVDLAIWPSRVLLPTPLPAKIPNLCPFAQVSSPSMARTPVARGSLILGLCIGGTGIEWRLTCLGSMAGGSPSMKRPLPLMILPSIAYTCTLDGMTKDRSRPSPDTTQITVGQQ